MRSVKSARLREASRMRRRPDWTAAAAAGLSAACLSGIFSIAAAWAAGRGAGYPARLAASLLLGAEALSPGTAGVVAWATGGLVHGLLSLAYAAVLADLVYRLRDRLAAVFGVAFGLAAYLFWFYALAAAFPGLSGARGWVAAGSHALFGAATAWLYKRFERRRLRPAGRVRL